MVCDVCDASSKSSTGSHLAGRQFTQLRSRWAQRRVCCFVVVCCYSAQHGLFACVCAGLWSLLFS